MRMQEVIAKLREEAPLLEKCAKNTDVLFNKAWGLFDDFRRAESDAGRMLLADAVCTALNQFAGEYRTLRCSVETVCMVNAEYKEKLGPGRRKAKSKDAPGQQMLGFGTDFGDAPKADEPPKAPETHENETPEPPKAPETRVGTYGVTSVGVASTTGSEVRQ